MDRNTSNSVGGTARLSPNRGQTGHISRQTVYYSSAAPRPVISPVVPFAPTLNQASEAAKRIVLPAIQQPVISKPIANNVGSFDMLTPKKPIAPSPIQHAIATANPAPMFHFTQDEAVPFRASEPSVARFADNSPLPTDLTSLFTTDVPQPNHKEPGKLGISFPKISIPKLLVGMAVTLFVAGAVVSFTSFKTNNNVTAQVKSAAKTQPKTDDDGGMAAGVPDEQGNPPSVDYYRTASSYPRVIRISKIQVEARVLALAIAPTGALKAPANIFDAGWYKDSSRPGEPGAMVVNGHVSGSTKPGLLKNIGKLTKGDKIEIERGDGEKFTYTVQATKVFDAEKLDMSSVMVPIAPGKSGLNIITAGGKFDEAKQTYEQRTVVYAVII